MQKLKKSIENNILKSIFKENSIIFNLEIDLCKDVGSPVKYINKNLTTNSTQRLKSLYNLETYHLKYPINLKIFESSDDLTQYFDFLKEKNKENSVVVTKIFNWVFKDMSYFVVKSVSSKQTFFDFRNLLNPQINLFKILKLIKTRFQSELSSSKIKF